MEKLIYSLPEAAIKIIQELIELEVCQRKDMCLISHYCDSNSFRLAKRFFYEKSNNEEGHYDMLMDFLISRGYNPALSVKEDEDDDEKEEYKSDFVWTDLRDAIKYSLGLCIEATEEYEKAARQMFAIDLMAYQMLTDKLSGCKYEIKEWTDLWKSFEPMMAQDQQREAETIYMSPICEQPSM